MDGPRLKLLEMILSEITVQNGTALVQFSIRHGQLTKGRVVEQTAEVTLDDVRRQSEKSA